MLEVEKIHGTILAESFRTLKINIQYSSLDKNNQVIVVTSSNLGEGKTFIASNLALILSRGNKRVILIDCNFRKPNIHKKFKLSNTLGLSEILAGEGDINLLIRKYNDNLDIITSGHTLPNPAEVLESEKMDSFIEVLRGEYDYIIFDTPPILFVSDAQILATKVDGTILVAKCGKTNKNEIKESYTMLKNINVNIIGTVLNGVKINFKKYF
ncbi:CpsD/CapB family tyrosine-protein kinase [uncultured Clostridium sp.]|uniref:CpsD/CapB family tyrosine-protein kinase n=1 Tax=uncultured Clostridium sp. TaxID=59620 RepID=UPI00258ADBEF|nr:CpsD/CapB family tyrosine-protein kinase [uncultured Clostridium sp.]